MKNALFLTYSLLPPHSGRCLVMIKKAIIVGGYLRTRKQVNRSNMQEDKMPMYYRYSFWLCVLASEG